MCSSFWFIFFNVFFLVLLLRYTPLLSTLKELTDEYLASSVLYSVVLVFIVVVFVICVYVFSFFALCAMSKSVRVYAMHWVANVLKFYTVFCMRWQLTWHLPLCNQSLKAEREQFIGTMVAIPFNFFSFLPARSSCILKRIWVKAI